MEFDIEKIMNEVTEKHIELFLKDESFFKEVISSTMKILDKDDLHLVITKYVSSLDMENLKKNGKKHQILKKFYQYLYSDNYVYLNGHKLDGMKSKLFNKMKNIDKFEEVFENADEDLLINDMIDNEVLFLKQNSMEKEICSLSLEDSNLEQIRKINPSFRKPNPSNSLYFLYNYIVSVDNDNTEKVNKEKIRDYLNALKNTEKYEENIKYIINFNKMWTTFVSENNVYSDLGEENNFLCVCNFYKEDQYSSLMEDDQMNNMILDLFIKICLFKSKNKNSESINESKVKEYYNKKGI